MGEATFRAGECEMVDYTPGADVDEGQVVLLGNLAGITCGIAARAIANGVKDALAVGGRWDVTMLGNYANWTKVYWDDAINKVVDTSTNMAQFGFIVDGGGGGANSTVRVLHFPFV